MSNLIIFDLDGVITSEDAYWDAAGLTLHELWYSPRYWNLGKTHKGKKGHYETNPLFLKLDPIWGLGKDGSYQPPLNAEESRRVSRAILPESEILALKARAINSNWDTCYAAVCFNFIGMLNWLFSSNLSEHTSLLPLRPWDAEWLAKFRHEIMHAYILREEAVHFSQFLDSPPFEGYVGLELINRLDTFASKWLKIPVEGVFSRFSPFWTFCQDIFQEWFLGDELYTKTYGHAPAQIGKPGTVYFEQPLLPVEQLNETLSTLYEQGYIPGFATGRVSQEARIPLEKYGILGYFAEDHRSPYDYVPRAEAELRAKGDQTLLGKPHPFQFLVAVDHQYASLETRNRAVIPPNFLVVGDSTSDILGGRAAGAMTVAVLTGARTEEARRLLARSEPDFTIGSITDLPALLSELDSLATIQKMQFTERKKAERLLQRWFARHMYLDVESVTLVPKAVSLNSFNGYYRSEGKEYFFKTHVEEKGVLEEYYHAEMLSRAGYNIVRPLRTLHQEGRQMVIYPVVHWPVMFDLMRAVETGKESDISQEMLVQAERRECERILTLYKSTLARSTAEEHARAPIHQLFWHRLTGERLKDFYIGKRLLLPESTDRRVSFENLLTYHWMINGQLQERTLGECIEQAKQVLNPTQASPTILGHGDAHFGNVFLEQQKDYLYFDPAFAGRHSPLLDIVKPLFHNIFATWMYFPQEIAQDFHLKVTIENQTVSIEHDYELTPLRLAMLQTKREYLLTPLIEWLRREDALPTDWQETLNLALMCCPLLTINLFDESRMPAKVSWLGLTLAVLMGNSGVTTWRNEE